MSTIVTRAGKGSQLTYTEVDSNFTNLNTDKIQATNSPGTSGQVLTSNGTNATWTTPASGGNNIITISSSGGSSITFPNTGEGNQTTNWTLHSSGGISGVSVSTVFFTLPSGTYNLQMPMAKSSSNNTYSDLRLHNVTAGATVTNITNMETVVLNGNTYGLMFPNNIFFTLASSSQLVFRTINAVGSTWTLNAQTGRYLINIYKLA